MKLLILLVAATALYGGCLPVEGDRIFARDVASVIPEFAGIPALEVIGLAPLPTVRRVMSGEPDLASGEDATTEFLAD